MKRKEVRYESMPCSDGPNFSVLLIVLLSLLLILHSPPANSYNLSNYQWNYCPRTDANYTTDGSFQANLNLLLTSLSTAAIPTGFANGTKGQALDQVYGLALCRGDISPADCGSCLNMSTKQIIKECPNGRSSAIWYEGCLLRYSDRSFFSTLDTTNKSMGYGLASDPEQFENFVGQMMDNLTTTAANISTNMFAAAVGSFMNSTLYALVQCTRDLPRNKCYRCLQDFGESIPQCCGGDSGASMYGLSCFLRYQPSAFFDLSKAIAWQPSADAPVSPPPRGHTDKTITIVIVTVTTVAVVVLLFSAICIYLRRRRKPARIPSHDEDGKENIESAKEIESAESLVFDLETLRSATDNFSDANKLGQGGYGVVYKGTLPDGQVTAVKRLLISSRQGLEQLRNEISLVAKLQHRDLVKLLGHCLEEQEKLLVYEYLPNGSLDKFLCDPIRRQQLEWGVRCRIIKRIGRGLLYLHEDSRLRIVHRDLKASNILLDEDMNPKISDFGLAKLFGLDGTHESTRNVAGTYGYMAPEYVRRGHFSVKSDVFSYGVLVLELVTGQMNSGFEGSGNAVDLPSYVWEQWNQGMASQVIDESLVDRCDLQEVLGCIHIGLLCVQADPAKRPSMAAVVLMLDGNSVSIPSPSLPAFYVLSRTISKSVELKEATSECSLDEVDGENSTNLAS